MLNIANHKPIFTVRNCFKQLILRGICVLILINKDFIEIILIFLCQVGYTNLAVFSLCEKQINRKMLNIWKRIFINLVFFCQKPWVKFFNNWAKQSNNRKKLFVILRENIGTCFHKRGAVICDNAFKHISVCGNNSLWIACVISFVRHSAEWRIKQSIL